MDGCSVRRVADERMVRGEIWLLGGSVCTGIALMMMYDGLRIFRCWYGTTHFGQAWRMRRIGSLPALRRSGFCSGTMTESWRGYAVAGVLGGMVFYDRTGSVFCLRY